MNLIDSIVIDRLVALHKAGKADRLWQRRCQQNGCRQAAAYTVRGDSYVVIFEYKVSPHMAESLGLEGRRVPGRVWPAGNPPSETLIAGCDHELYHAEFTREPRVLRWDRITSPLADQINNMNRTPQQ